MSETGLLTATGKRKNSIARVRLQPGTGEMKVNNRPLENYFPREYQRFQIMRPFEATGTMGKYDVTVNVRGGGEVGQAGAVRHGVAKALLLSNPDFRPILRKATLLTRDSREKERKKYGQKGARARFQFSKR